MTILAELTGTVTVTDDGSSFVLGDVEITDAGTFWFVVNVDERASVAFAQRFQQHGVRVTIDRGDGVMVPVRDRELGRVLKIEESADSYGDTLTFQLVGERFSPFSDRTNFRAKRKVEVHTVTGTVAHPFRAKVFTGWIVSTSWETQPPTLTVTCMDAAALYATKRAPDYSLEPNSGKSRLQIGLELLAVGGIPVGYVDLGGDGGVFNKPVVPGEQPILDYVRDFWGVLGVVIGFEHGLLCARRYSSSLPAVLELHAGNLCAPVAVDSPALLEPNVLGVVAVAFDRVDINGLRTGAEESVITVGPYAPLVGDGVTSDGTRTRVISEVLTRTTYLGTLATRVVQEEFGWYARRAASNQIRVLEFAETQDPDDPVGYKILPSSLPFWTYADGSTRGDPSEQYQLLHRSVTAKSVDADYNVIGIREEQYDHLFIRKALWIVAAGEDVLDASPTYINDDGDGILYGREVIGTTEGSGALPNLLRETSITLNPDGTIKEEVIVESSYGIGQQRRRATSAYGYGLDATTYTHQSQETWGPRRTITRRYRAIGEDGYEVVERTVAEGQQPRTVVSTLTGAPPRPDRAEPETSAQEIRSEFADYERIALAGEEISDVQHNEFVQDSAEAAAYARHLARRAGARVLRCDVPVEGVAHKLRIVRVNLPNASIDGERFYVWTVGRDFATFRESISAENYPASLG